MVARIVEDFDPARILLFGSHARGDARPDSDVDLLVVMPVAGSRCEEAIEIGVALDDIAVPKDIVVVTPESFERRRNAVGTIEWPGSHEAKLLHVRRRFAGAGPQPCRLAVLRPARNGRKLRFADPLRTLERLNRFVKHRQTIRGCPSRRGSDGSGQVRKCVGRGAPR
ncbi:MAG: nucleotidyltransferase domain-containing protein [Planctomycetes bacterium]|nr:nucleotidyltransferase domain-containing protein [Planctomycetota bacterium]